MIPKIVHYFANNSRIYKTNTNSTVRMCLHSWQTYLKGYKFILWSDKDPEVKRIINQSKFAKKAYELGLWAFLSDYIRYYALYNYGGIYLDTDVQIVKNFDKFLTNKLFISIEGHVNKNENIPEPAVFGAIPKHPLLKELLKVYEGNEIFNINFTAPNIMKTKLFELYNFRYINYKKIAKSDFNNLYLERKYNHSIYMKEEIWTDANKMVTIYPSRFFCPCWAIYREEAFVNDTHSIHWNQSSWHDINKIEKLKSKNNSYFNGYRSKPVIDITYKQALSILFKKTFNIKSYSNRIKNLFIKK